jgi:hypothetical protein
MKRRIPSFLSDSWTIFIIALAASLLVLLPIKTHVYQEQVPYVATENYSVVVPYEGIEEYTERVPYQTEEQRVESVPVEERQQHLERECDDVSVRYTAVGESCTSEQSSYRVTNIDTVGGTFSFSVGYKNAAGQFIGETSSKEISPGASAIFSYGPAPPDAVQCSAKAESVPKKEVCGYDVSYAPVTTYKDVIKTEQVTKYRDETRYRKVMLNRTEIREKEVLRFRNETRCQEINWLFGFTAIVRWGAC